MPVIKRSDIYQGGKTFAKLSKDIDCLLKSVEMHGKSNITTSATCAYCDSIKNSMEQCVNCGANKNK